MSKKYRSREPRHDSEHTDEGVRKDKSPEIAHKKVDRSPSEAYQESERNDEWFGEEKMQRSVENGRNDDECRSASYAAAFHERKSKTPIEELLRRT